MGLSGVRNSMTLAELFVAGRVALREFACV